MAEGKTRRRRKQTAERKYRLTLPKVSREPGESLLEYNRRRYHMRTKFIRRAIKAGNKKCQFCGLLLRSKLSGPRASKYCVDCRNDPATKRYIMQAYRRRSLQKKAGAEQEKLIFAEDID